MDLGISGKWAIIGASNRGLGKGCALALAQAGCNIVVNGLDGERLEATAALLDGAGPAQVVAVAGDISSPAVQDALFDACPSPDILITNNGGPAPRPFEELDRGAILAGI